MLNVRHVRQTKQFDIAFKAHCSISQSRGERMTLKIFISSANSFSWQLSSFLTRSFLNKKKAKSQWHSGVTPLVTGLKSGKELSNFTLWYREDWKENIQEIGLLEKPKRFSLYWSFVWETKSHAFLKSM